MATAPMASGLTAGAKVAAVPVVAHSTDAASTKTAPQPGPGRWPGPDRLRVPDRLVLEGTRLSGPRRLLRPICRAERVRYIINVERPAEPVTARPASARQSFGPAEAALLRLRVQPAPWRLPARRQNGLQDPGGVDPAPASALPRAWPGVPQLLP